MAVTVSDRGSQNQELLAAFGRALGQEAHLLVSRPELTWQQLHNRLQWVEGAVAERAAAERERRSSPGAVIWAATRTRFRESEELIRTLAGHTGEVLGCAVSPDGTWLVSASGDKTLRVWEAASGECLRTLEGHTGEGAHPTPGVSRRVGRFSEQIWGELRERGQRRLRPVEWCNWRLPSVSTSGEADRAAETLS